jgi:DNA-binding response OmpR family regulator
MEKLLLIEDDRLLCINIQDWFEHKHYLVECAHNGNDGLTLMQCFHFDLVILDAGLPGMSGFELCRRYRACGGKTPILFVTGQDQLKDKEEGYSAGADDYLIKPFFFEELSLKVQAILRRTGAAVDNILHAGELELNTATFTVFRGGEQLQLTRREFDLLEFLMRNPKKVFSPETILNHAWKSDWDASPETVRVSILRLRKKIDVKGKPSVIRNLHGVGYCLDAQPVRQAS